MRRVKWLPTVTLFGVAVLIAGAFAVGVRAMQAGDGHNHCLRGCGPKETPASSKPPCCQPPPCEYEYGLRVTTAKVRSAARTKKQSGPSGSQWAYKGPTPAQMATLAAKYFGGGTTPQSVLNAKATALEIIAAQFAECTMDKPYIEQQPFKVDPGYCTVTQVQNGQPVVIDTNDPASLEKAKDAAQQCRESVEADWYRAKTLHDICVKNNGLTAATQADAEQQANETALKSMQEQLSQFIESCKKFKNFKSARDAVKQAEQMLAASGGKNIPQNQRKFSGKHKPGAGRGSQQ